jgi:hypothetical protein
MIHQLLCVAVLASLGCDSNKTEARFTPPPITVGAGMPAFHMVKDEVSTDKERVEIRIALDGPVERDAIDALVKDVYRQAMTRLAVEPSAVAIYVHPKEGSAAAPLATFIKRQSDKGPVLENKVALTFPKAVTAALHGDTFVGSLQPKVEIDEAKHAVTLTIPYVEPGKDAWAGELSYPTALATFTEYAQRLYQTVPDLNGLTFIGVWKDQPVVRVTLASKEDYNTLDLYALGERIGGKQGRTFAEAQLTHKSDAVLTKEKRAAERKEYEAALAKLPKGSVFVAAALK